MMAPFRAGFVALVGRPNAGKSTLLNRLTGEKLAIVSPRPQTTRNRITGIRNLPGAQVVFVDTPGLQRSGPAPGPGRGERHRSAGGGALGEFMAKTVERALEDIDLVCLVVDAAAAPYPDPDALALLRGVSSPVFCCLNKADLVRPKARLLAAIDAWRGRHAFQEILPVSAADGTNCDRLLDLVAGALPEHPAFFPADATTDQPETFYVAEIIREKIFRLTHQEVPYASAVRVTELTERVRPPCLYIRASIFVEQPSQKAIVIGRGGARLKAIGSAARRELEAFFGIKVFLQVSVAVRRNWRKDERALREFGLLQTS
jgi:GTP-binding protein Era